MQNPARVGTIYYNRGVIAAVNFVEAMKNAQKIHNKVGKTDHRCGIPRRLRSARLHRRASARSSASTACSRRTSCPAAITTAAGKFHMMQWDGSKFQIVTKDWMAATNPTLIRKLIEDSAEKYAKENNITLARLPES